VRLGDVLRRSSEAIEPLPDVEYREITVRLWGNGVVERGRVLGIALTGRRYVAREGQFIVSRIDARNGAMGLVPKVLDGALVSNDFPLFDADPRRLCAGYLGWLARTTAFVELCQRASEGTTNRVRLSEGAFPSLEIPLPPLPEQQRLVAALRAVESDLERARSLHGQAVADSEQLCRSLLRHQPQASRQALREVVSLRAPDVTVEADQTYHFAGVYSFGRGVFAGERKSGLEFSYPKLTRLRTADFVYPKLMAWEGAFGVVPPECDGLVVSTEFPVFTVNRDKVLPEVLDTYFRDPALWPDIAGASIGTNVRRRRLNPRDFLDRVIPIPSIETQQTLRRMRAEVDALKAAQAARRAELDALLPAILDRAFAGTP
jgi:type I restriction enzyme S subunit